MKPNFQLRNFKTRLLDNGILLIGFDHVGRQVNVLSSDVLYELADVATYEVLENEKVKGAVVVSLKDSFIAGADIEEIASISKKEECESLVKFAHSLFDAMSYSPKPFVAAIEGACFGGGFELALACDWRVASDRPGTVFGLPEVKLGIIPGFGGTQRLPKLTNLDQALDIIMTGKSIYPYPALKRGLIDDLVGHSDVFCRSIATIDKERFVQVAVQRAIELASEKKLKRKKLGLGFMSQMSGWPVARNFTFMQARKLAGKSTGGHYPAPLEALEAIKNGLGKKTINGCLEAEMPRLLELIVSPLSKDLIDVYFQNEKAKKSVVRRAVKNGGRIDVMGAGLMGTQIAGQLSAKGFDVLLKDISYDVLASAKAFIEKSERENLRKRTISQSEFEKRLLRVSPTIDMKSFAGTSFAIEAVAENIELKRKLLAEFEDVALFDAIFATNTSFFMVSEIASRAKHRERCVGMHFFNPVGKMPLVEVVRAEFTSQQAVDTALWLAGRLGKVPILVGDGPGFLVNRILARYMTEALFLLADGLTIEDIDGAAKRYGMAIDSGRPMGPFRLIDFVGIKTAYSALKSSKKLGPRMNAPEFIESVAEKNMTFYLDKEENPGIYTMLTVDYGWSRKKLAEKEIQDRLFLPMVDEALRCIGGGIISDPKQLDLAMLLGAGFPAFRGGLLKHAVRNNMNRVHDDIEKLAFHNTRFWPFEDFLAVARVVEGYYR
ncbi:MAG: 3-hydroxyacyl-CoA dehydrogenase NAD-binding domain-containing protein [bacterium]|nr:3-hydroxyacyl-CoA dehydrogenase NAD-binding domain-containing protein [bacterium]